MNSSLRFYTVLLKKLHLILSKLVKFRGAVFLAHPQKVAVYVVVLAVQFLTISQLHACLTVCTPILSVFPALIVHSEKFLRIGPGLY